MKQITTIIAIFVISLAAQISFGQANKTSRPEDKETFVKGTRLLEQDPFNKNAKKIRSSLLFWLIEAPDVSVTLCSDFLPVGEKYKYAPEITGQFTYGMGSFIIENPNRATDQKAVFQGGLESVSRMYESMLKEQPKARNDFLNGLVEKRNKGEVGKFVEGVLNKGGCK
ncbi:hypothetical protein BH20ACI2_BH20ACI2_05180 [soil metagenome]